MYITPAYPYGKSLIGTRKIVPQYERGPAPFKEFTNLRMNIRQMSGYLLQAAFYRNFALGKIRKIATDLPAPRMIGIAIVSAGSAASITEGFSGALL